MSDAAASGKKQLVSRIEIIRVLDEEAGLQTSVTTTTNNAVEFHGMLAVAAHQFEERRRP